MIDHPPANQDGHVRILVLHFTDETFARSLDLLSNPHPNPVSAHYLVSRPGDDGRGAAAVYRLVDAALFALLARYRGDDLQALRARHPELPPPRAPGAG